MKNYKYTIDILPEADGKGYYVVVPALPGCYSQGSTVEEALQNAEEAIALHVSELKRTGEGVPIEGSSFQSIVEVAA